MDKLTKVLLTIIAIGVCATVVNPTRPSYDLDAFSHRYNRCTDRVDAEFRARGQDQPTNPVFIDARVACADLSR